MTSVDTSILVPGTWTLLKTLEAPASHLRFVNDSLNLLYISYDGVHYHDFIFADDFNELSFQPNNMPRACIANMAEGTNIYVTGIASVGNIYCSGFSSGII